MNTHITAQGNASRNAELKQSGRGNEYATVNIAVNIEDRKGDNDNPPPWWLRVMAFGRVADQLCEVQRGDRIVVTGTLKRSRYTSQQGQARESWTVFADQVHSVRRRQQDPQEQQQQSGYRQDTREDPPGDGFDGMDDDISGDGIPF